MPHAYLNETRGSYKATRKTYLNLICLQRLVNWKRDKNKAGPNLSFAKVLSAPFNLAVNYLNNPWTRRSEGGQAAVAQQPLCKHLVGTMRGNTLTPLLHKDKEVIQKFFPFRVTVQFIQLQVRPQEKTTMKHPISLQVLPQSSYRHLSNYRCDSSATHISVCRGKTQFHCRTVSIFITKTLQTLAKSREISLPRPPSASSLQAKAPFWRGQNTKLRGEWESWVKEQDHHSGKDDHSQHPCPPATRKAYSGPSTIFSWISCFVFEDGFKIWLVGGWVPKEPFSLHWQRWMLLMLDNAKKDTKAHSPKNPHPSWLSTNCHFETHSLSNGREEAQFSSQHCTEVKGQVSGANFSLSTQPTTRNYTRRPPQPETMPEVQTRHKRQFSLEN